MEVTDLPDGNYSKVGVKLNRACAKLENCYHQLDETLIYHVALALHPTNRRDWFEVIWADRVGWIHEARSMVYDSWFTKHSRDLNTNTSKREWCSKRQRRGVVVMSAFKTCSLLLFVRNSCDGFTRHDIAEMLYASLVLSKTIVFLLPTSHQ